MMPAGRFSFVRPVLASVFLAVFSNRIVISSQRKLPEDGQMELHAAIEQLHNRCAVYTSGPTAARLLDLAGWTASADLSKSVLLEPCVGEGAILLEGVLRLIRSQSFGGRSPTYEELKPRIKGYELHPGAVATVRGRLRSLLIAEGMSSTLAGELVEAWVCQEDFLLAPQEAATHVVANPPYVRWKNLPPLLATLYKQKLVPASTNGDLSVAFLDRMQEWASNDGRIVALISDRFLFAQYGDAFLKMTKARGWTISIADERPSDPFVKAVGAYSAIVLLTQNSSVLHSLPVTRRESARITHQDLLARYGSLYEAGCTVRVGPALGAGRTFILAENEATEVEEELVRPFVERKDLKGLEVSQCRLQVVVPYDLNGTLIEPTHWPGFQAWINERKDVLLKRSHFLDKQQYWRTIDAVPSIWSKSPKLLLPELSNKPFVTVDRTGAVPAHSLYAIWPGEWPIKVLQRVLNAGLLDLTARAEAPALKMGWMRFYKRFVMRTPLPRWEQLSSQVQERLSSSSETIFEDAFYDLFGFAPMAASSE